MKNIIRLCALALCLLLACPPAFAAETDAQDITASTTISGTGFDSFDFLKNGNTGSFRTSGGNATITLENSRGIASLYLYFDLEYGAYTITNNATGAAITAGQYGILHEFVDLETGFGTVPTSVTLHFDSGKVRLSEIYSFTSGSTPDFVQKWAPPLEGGADILLFSAHSDDDQLFFAGLIPQYAGQLGYRVQVVLMTDHRLGPYATNGRTHEVLNGMWATGLTAYPVFGNFVDYLLEDLDAMYKYYESIGTSREALQGFVVEQLRRFKPQVAIGHDLQGEYKHGMHMVYADLLTKALDIAPDESQFPDSAAKYGTWQVLKTYLHLYKEDPIVIDYDQPLDRFDGLTAFQASQKLGYPCHKSQQWTWFTRWLNGSNGQITKVTQISTYNPAQFGLYRSTVGPDISKNDFMENIIPYAQQEAENQAAADQVIEKIGQIGTVTLQSRPVIEAARSAFDGLTAKQQALVTNLEALTAAEAALDQLEADNAAQIAADKAAAAAVQAQIDALGTITLESAGALEAAQAAYDALTPVQKGLVSNAQQLADAKETLAQLQAAQNQDADQQTQLQQLLIAVVALIVLVIALVLVLVQANARRARRRRRRRP